MPFFSLKPRQTESQAAVATLIEAGRAITDYLAPRIGKYHECVCGTVLHVERPESHHNFCPVARFYIAAESARKAVRA